MLTGHVLLDFQRLPHGRLKTEMRTRKQIRDLSILITIVMKILKSIPWHLWCYTSKEEMYSTDLLQVWRRQVLQWQASDSGCQVRKLFSLVVRLSSVDVKMVLIYKLSIYKRYLTITITSPSLNTQIVSVFSPKNTLVFQCVKSRCPSVKRVGNLTLCYVLTKTRIYVETKQTSVKVVKIYQEFLPCCFKRVLLEYVWQVGCL